MMKVFCIQNSTRKLSKSHAAFINACKLDLHIEFIHFKTEYPNHASKLAQQAKETAELILLIGGDGTINEVVNGLCATSGKNPKLFILPGGTGNDFYRNFKGSNLLALTPSQLFIQKGVEVSIARLQTKECKRYFINIADIGFGGSVVKELNALRNRFGSGFSYFIAIILTFLKYKNPKLSLSYNGITSTQKYFMIAVCNGPVFGKGLIISPGTDPKAREFGLVILGDVSIFDYLRHLPKLWRGKRIVHPEISYKTTDEVLISSSSGDIFAETDGEFIASSSFQMSFHPEILEILS